MQSDSTLSLKSNSGPDATFVPGAWFQVDKKRATPQSRQAADMMDIAGIYTGKERHISLPLFFATKAALGSRPDPQ